MTSSSTAATTTPTGATAPPAAPVRHVATPTEDLVTALLGSLIILGAAIDGWAHVNILSAVQADGFFTPWHGMLYSAFAATAGWTFFLAYRRRDRSPRWWVDGWPVGYRIGAAGVGVFLLAGLMDMVWHTVFGVEVTLDALLSPSHLLLLIGTVMLLTSPVRSWWHAGGRGRRAAGAVFGLALGTTAASVFLGYVSYFEHVYAVLPYDGVLESPSSTTAVVGVAGYVVTTTMMVVPLLLTYQRRAATPGLATALVACVGTFPLITHEFPALDTVGVAGSVAAAALADLILVRLDAVRGLNAYGRLPLAAGLFAALVTSGHLLAVHLYDGIRWPAELWTGSIMTATVVAAVVGGLAGCSGRVPRGDSAAPAAPTRPAQPTGV
jgi:hypothetical protein